MEVKNELQKTLTQALLELGSEGVNPELELASDSVHGDYTSNVALALASKTKQNPRELAEKIKEHISSSDFVEKIEVAGPGFINFYLSHGYIISKMQSLLNGSVELVNSSSLTKKKILVEYAHPNTHKEMHIGHMRTLITGEALARLLEKAGATVFRANYQGDIGPHVAKAIYGINKLIEDRGLSFSEIQSWSNTEKAHFLGEGYVRGNQDYEMSKEYIDTLNSTLYQMVLNPGTRTKTEEDKALWETYEMTRMWSLDYYHDFYIRFSTKFDHLFFEKDMVKSGKDMVLKNLGTVFTKNDGAVIFEGEKYGLHTRVFITQSGNPTYEGKEMGNAFAEYSAFPFDLKMHVVANEQAGYFKVVFKALELIDGEKFKDKQYHVNMGMVHLSDRKMSSRTGEVITVDGLLDQVKAKVDDLISEGKLSSEDKEKVIEQIVVGAVKYSVLKVGTGQDVAFDIEKSISLDGDSGTYLQYTYVRTQSILRKAEAKQEEFKLESTDILQEKEEVEILRLLVKFESEIVKSAEQYAPNILCNYLFTLARLFNLYYQKHKIVGSNQEKERLALTAAVGKTIKQGLNVLGIEAPEKM